MRKIRKVVRVNGSLNRLNRSGISSKSPLFIALHIHSRVHAFEKSPKTTPRVLAATLEWPAGDDFLVIQRNVSAVRVHTSSAANENPESSLGKSIRGGVKRFDVA